MSRTAPGILVLDPSGELADCLGAGAMPAVAGRLFIARTGAEALAWRRSEGPAAVVVASAERLEWALRTAGDAASVAVAIATGPAPRGAFRCLRDPVDARDLRECIEDALAFARERTLARRTAVLRRRAERQHGASRRALRAAADRIRALASANVRLKEMTTGLVRLAAMVAEGSAADEPTRAERVARVALSLARRMGVPASMHEDLRLIAMLHRIGDAAQDHEATLATGSNAGDRTVRLLESIALPAGVIDGVRFQHGLPAASDDGLDPAGWTDDDRAAAGGLARIVSVASAFVDLVATNGRDGGGDVTWAVAALGAAQGGDGRPVDAAIVAALRDLAGDEDELHRLGLHSRLTVGASP